jgi:hypothetical protein
MSSSDGASVEEMTVEVNKAAAALESSQKELTQMAQLNKVLRVWVACNPYH